MYKTRLKYNFLLLIIIMSETTIASEFNDSIVGYWCKGYNVHFADKNYESTD